MRVIKKTLAILTATAVISIASLLSSAQPAQATV